MTRYLLDTNIISNVTKPVPSEALLNWISEQPDDDLFIFAITIAEVWRGILHKPQGEKRSRLENWFAGSNGPRSLFAGRILPFDEAAGVIWARLMFGGTVASRPRSPVDMMIAAIAEANDCTIVTDNEKDFVGMSVLNPLRSSS